jgi:hypothetical protein
LRDLLHRALSLQRRNERTVRIDNLLTRSIECDLKML